VGKVLESITPELAAFVARQHVFFVATAPSGAGGHVNLSPKGLDTFVVVDERTVAWLDLTGSGVETIAHLRENGRVTVMFCAFEGPPTIVRLYGRGVAHPVGSAEAAAFADRFADLPGARAIVVVAVDRVSTSCGYAVPVLRYEADRPTLLEWAERRGPEGIRDYWADKNAASIDGLPGLTAQ
jgi:hypothetical protein